MKLKSGPLSLPGGVVCALLLLLGALALPAGAAHEDFEFAEKLVEAKLFDLAGKVYDAVLADEARSAADRDRARYLWAILKTAEASSTADRHDATYEPLCRQVADAAAAVQVFVETYPANPHTLRARQDLVSVRLALAELAIERFDRPAAARDLLDAILEDLDDWPETPRAAIAALNAHYLRTLTSPPGSPERTSALKETGMALEAFIMDHDGSFVALRAQELYGRTWQQLALSEPDARTRHWYHGQAFDWFASCVSPPANGDEHLRLAGRAYAGLAEIGLAGVTGRERDLAAEAITLLEEMRESFPRLDTTREGLRSQLNWSRLECQRGHADRALAIAMDALDRAERARLPSERSAAYDLLTACVSGVCGDRPYVRDPAFLRRVADALYGERRFEQAIRVYRAIILYTSTSSEDFIAFRWHAWRRIARSYHHLGDRLAEATAYEPIHEAWIGGRIPWRREDWTDSNMYEAGNNRRRAQSALKELADLTQAEVFRRLHREITESFHRDYPTHSLPHRGSWNAAIHRWRETREQRKAGDDGWRVSLDRAYAIFVQVSEDAQHARSDSAWVYRIRTWWMRGEYARAVDEGEAAWAFWNSEGARANAAKFATVRTRRLQAKAFADYWMAACFLKLERYAEAAARLTGWHERYPDAAPPYPSLAYDILIQAHLTLEDIESADRYYRALLASDPEHPSLPRVTQDLAGHFNDQRVEINAQLVVAQNERNRTRWEFRRAERRTYRLAALLVDLQRQREYARSPRRGALERERELEARIAEVKASLQEWNRRREGAETRLHQQDAKVSELRERLYVPLLRSATYWYAWDRSLIATDAERDARNLLIFARMFRKLGRVRPNERPHWEKSRELYEAFLAFPEIAATTLEDDEKRGALSELGQVLVALAKLEPDAEQRSPLVDRAAEVLEAALARNDEDREAVLEMLGSVVDPDIYRRRGNTGVDFRLALAQVLSWSEDEDDLRRAVNVAASLVAPPLGVGEDSGAWWEARAIQLETYLAFARRNVGRLRAEDDARKWLQRAGKVYEGLVANYPDLDRGNEVRWAAILQELNALRAEVRLEPLK